MTTIGELRLNPSLDGAALARRFAADGRVRIEGFLADDLAARIHAYLRGHDGWRQVLNSGDAVFELDRATRASMPAEQRAALDDAVHAGARNGFQYRYETLRLREGAGEGGDGDPVLSPLVRWMSGGAVRDLLRTVTGRADIAFADGQATAYAPGDFLTAHTDEVAGKARRAAYVFGLNPAWRPEWGGLLLFHGDGQTVSGVAPGFNTLDLFAVPQVHSVSMVTQATPVRRYAITGWLRAAGQG